MQQFTEKYREQIQGVVSGFDRLVFRGLLRGLNYGYWIGACKRRWRWGWSNTSGAIRFRSRITWIM